jgi:homoserine kinase
VSGVIIADKLFDLGLSVSEKLRYCVEIEGHPDNASASLCGGFVVCCGLEDHGSHRIGARSLLPTALVLTRLSLWLPPGVSSVYARKMPYSDKVRAVVAIPDFEVSTEKARQALPPTYSRADVVRDRFCIVCFIVPVVCAAGYIKCGVSTRRCSTFSEWASWLQPSLTRESTNPLSFARQ